MYAKTRPEMHGEIKTCGFPADFGSIFDWHPADFGSILDWHPADFGSIFGLALKRFGLTLGGFFTQVDGGGGRSGRGRGEERLIQEMS